ncbi:filamentous hemagglutinin N-terminal domain-containing protein, partial [Rhodanobacter caeni]|uniref:two-partner secretion domain-containing protein n=1 Tax=Rhodanobacter caeni TaxID=657654 RepID=UPI0031DE8FC3
MNNTIDAKTRTPHAASLPPHAARLRRKLLPVSLSLLLASPFVFGGEAMAAAVGATTGPTGGTVVGGIGSIVQNGANTVINQNSARLALDWQTFNVGKDASVKFNQPSFNAVALNRILDQNPSQIFGHVSSNGQVFLINTHGIIFGASAQLNVGGLMASTLDLTPKDFLASRYNLDAHGERAGIVNHGLIQAASGGSVSLVGGSVANDGVILANYGRINLDGADRAVLDFDGNGLINIQVTGALKQRLDGSEAAVSNRGTLKADSGTVVLQASAAKDLFTNLVNNSGVIDAGGISTQGGVVRLVAAGGNTENSGAINVSGAQGGSVQLLSDQNVSVTGHVDASGSHGGGSIRVGGGYQGGEGLQAAAVTYVGPGASLNADAVDSGNGGSVVLWSNTATGFKGSISARGGAAGGNGGMAEVSSLGYLAFDGFADLRAPHGAWGTLLLDPNDITISDDVDANPVAPGGFDASGAFTPGDATAASTINTATIVTQLGSSDVNIKTTDGDITVVNGFTYNGDNDRTLTLDAFGTLTFKNGAVIQSTGGTGGTHTLGGDLTGTGGVVFEAGSSFITNGGDLAVNGGAFTLDGALDAGAGTVTLDSSDAISQTGGVITAGTLTGSSVGATTLDGTNAVDALGDFSAASFSLTNGAALTIAGDIVAGDPGDAGADPVVPPTAGNITLSATGALTQGTGSSLTSNGGDISLTGSAMSLSGTLDASNSDTTGDVSLASTAGGLSVQDITGDTVSLNATGGGITQTDGLITAATLTGSATGDVTLNRSTNAIATLDDFSAANIWVANSTGLTLAGNIVAGDAAGTPVVPGNITLSAGGVITQNAGTSLVSNGGDISLTGNAVTLSGTLDASNPDITGDVTLTSGGGGLSVQDITGDTVTMNATGGGITQTDGVITAATLTGSAAGDATLNRSTNVIAKLDGFSAANISLANSTALTLAGNIVAGDAGATPAVAGNITLSAGGVITQDAGSSLASNGGDISVTGSAVTLNGTLDASNPDTTGDVSLTSSAGGLSVQDITGDTVTMNATGGGITQTDGLITAAVLTGSASGDLTLNRSTNVIAALDDFSAANIWVANSTLLTIAGNIVAGDAGGTPVVPGNITLSSGGVITQSASSSLASNGGDISITGSATGPGSTLILDGTLDAGSGAVSLSTAAGDLTLGGDVTGATVTLIADNGSVDGVDGSIKQTAGSITATDVTLNATGGVQLGQIDAANMEVSAAGDITQLGGASDALLISGTSHLDAGAHAITLDNTSNHFTGAVSLTNSGAHDVTLDNGSNALVLGNLQVGSGTLTVSGKGITQAASTAITQAATAGAAQFDAGAGALQLGNANTLTGAVSLANSGANNVTLNNGSNALTLGTSTLGSGTFNLAGTGPTTLAGNLTTSGGAITLSGPVTLGAASTGINTTGGGATTGAAITFSGTVDGASTLTLNAGTAGAVTLDGAVGATTALTGLDVTAGSFSAKALNIGSGGLAVTTQAGDITQGGAFTVAGTSSFDAGAHAITLDNAGNHFTGAVSLANSGANNVTLDNGSNALVLGDVQVGSGTLTVSGVGITQATGTAVTQTAGAGAAQFDAGAGVLQLDNTNTLTGAVSLTNSGANGVTLDNGSNALVLGDVQVGSGTLSVSGVGITQATGTAVTQAASAGAAQFNAGAGVLQLDNANTLTGAVSLANSGANNVTLNNGSNALTLGTSTLGSGTFNLTDTGPTTLAGNLTTSGGAITLSGPVTLGAASTGINTTGGGATTGAAITFSGTVDGASTLTLNAGTAGAVTLDGAVGATTALTGLDVTAGSFSAKALNIGSGGLAVTTQAGDITQGGAFTVSGASSFDAGAHAITLANTGNHFTGAVSLANSGANNVTLDNGSNALVLGDVQVGSGTLTVSGVGITQAAGSAITQAAGAGAAQFNAGAGVLQLGNANTLTGAVSLNNSGANDVTLDNGTHALTLGTSTLGSGAFSLEGSGQTTLAGDLTTSGGAITLSGPVTLGSSTTGIHTTGGGATTGAAITFDGALDGASGLTLDAGTAGVVTLGGAVGASTALTGLTVTAGSFSANALNIGSGGLAVTTQAGDITQGGTGAFTVAGTSNFTAMNGHQITLDNTDNDFQAGVTATGTGVSITDTNDLTIDALNNGSNGTVSLIAGGALLLPTGAIDTGTADLTLAANGGTLTAPGALSGANVTLSGQGDITLSDAVTATGTLSLTSLGGLIKQEAGSLTAAELTGSSVDSTQLDGTNHIASLGNFTANGFSLTNSQGLSVTGVVDGGASTALTTTSGDLTIDGTLKGTTVTLTSAGAIGEDTTGVIDATTLKGSSQGDTVLDGANLVDTLDNFSAANFTLVNAQGLATTGALTTTGGTGSISLTTSSGALSLGSNLSGGAISLDSADSLALAKDITGTTVELISSGGGISQSAGIITAGTLSGSAADSVALGQLNQLAALGNFDADGFSLTNGAALAVSGVVDGGGSTALTTQAGDLTINGTLRGTTVTLTSAGAIGEGATGVIEAATLTGTSQGNTVLGGANRVDALGNFDAANFSFVNAQDLAVNGALTTAGGAGGISLKTSSGTLGVNSDLTASAVTLDSADDLALAHAIDASVVALAAGGDISQSSGVITAGTLTGQSTGTTTLGGANLVGTLGSFKASNFSLVNAAGLSVNGPLQITSPSGGVSLKTTAGILKVNSVLSA